MRCASQVESFTAIEMLYLSLYYTLILALLAAVVLGTLSSRFSFIVPLMFYNRYVDSATWDERFQVMSVQIASLPLLVGDARHIPIALFLAAALCVVMTATHSSQDRCTRCTDGATPTSTRRRWSSSTPSRCDLGA